MLNDEPTWRCHQNPFIGAHRNEREDNQRKQERYQRLLIKDGPKILEDPFLVPQTNRNFISRIYEPDLVSYRLACTIS